MLLVRMMRSRILLQLRILPFPGHHRHMPDVRCKPDSAPCSAQPADSPHEAAERNTVWQVDRLAACLDEAAESLQRTQGRCARVNGKTEWRFRVVQALADHGGPECTQAKLAGNLHQFEIEPQLRGGTTGHGVPVVPQAETPRWLQDPAGGHDGRSLVVPVRRAGPVAARQPAAGIMDRRAVAGGSGRHAKADRGFGWLVKLHVQSEPFPGGYRSGCDSSVPFERPLGAL